jgi:hypothetical protein
MVDLVIPAWSARAVTGLGGIRVIVVRGGALVGCALALVGCGSSGGAAPNASVVSAFSKSQRAAVEQALSHLQRTSIPRTVVATSYQTGEAPTLCNLLPIQGAPGTFRLFIAWNPNGPNGLWAPRSMLEASINRASARDDEVRVWSSGEATTEPASIKASFIRAALAQPSARCEALQDGALELAGSG